MDGGWVGGGGRIKLIIKPHQLPVKAGVEASADLSKILNINSIHKDVSFGEDF